MSTWECPAVVWALSVVICLIFLSPLWRLALVGKGAAKKFKIRVQVWILYKICYSDKMTVESGYCSVAQQRQASLAFWLARLQNCLLRNKKRNSRSSAHAIAHPISTVVSHCIFLPFCKQPLNLLLLSNLNTINIAFHQCKRVLVIVRGFIVVTLVSHVDTIQTDDLVLCDNIPWTFRAVLLRDHPKMAFRHF